MDGDIKALPIVEARTLDGPVVKTEAERTHQMERDAKPYAESSYGPGVMGYLRSDKNYGKIHGLILLHNRHGHSVEE